MSTTLTAAQLKTYRAETYRLKPALKLNSPAEAVKFVNARGFVYFWPIKGVELPSLWVAVAGNRPVANAHDDPGHITWRWKDSMLGAHKWFYTKLLRGKATMVSLKTIPYFYALSENYGDLEQDYLQQYAEGRLTQEAKIIFETLLHKGALDTVALRREARLTSADSNTRFERALTELQTGLKILPVGVAEAGAWRYAFIYEVVDRYLPDLAQQARDISRAEACAQLINLYLRSVGAATEKQVAQLFHWKPDEVARGVATLIGQRKARHAEIAAGAPGSWVATSALWK